MRKELPRILVTGGAGFIGSAFVRLLLRDCPRQSYSEVFKRGLSLKDRVIVVDKLTYAGDLKRLKEVEGRYKFYKADIYNKKTIESVFKRENPQTVVHFAAETHVDRSILDSVIFMRTNLIGTQVLLDLSRKYKIKKFIHISSDEVYGDILKGKFTENSPLKPNSPYAASKAAIDLLIRSYIRTYAFPAIIIRPSNNYGPWQYPEKLIPMAILKILRNEKIPIYGQGKNVREWLFVDDCAGGILQIMEKGKIGEIYNLGSHQERQNIEMVRSILKIFKKDDGLIEFVRDRLGHDIRYRMDSNKVFNKIGWRPKLKFADGLCTTVQWCLKNKIWLFSKWGSVCRLYKR